jgi:hypothetical protein
MSYGSRTGADGKVISADGSGMPEVGIVDNVSIKDAFEISDDGKYVTITFVQASGAEVKHREWDNSDDAAAVEYTNRRIKHICTKLVTEAEYDAAVEGAGGFEDFFRRVRHLIEGRTSGTFRMLFHYNDKGFVVVPRFPNFIEHMKTVPSKLSISNYVQKRLTKPAKPSSDLEDDSASESIDTGETTNKLPFEDN